jgi:hypothetical protein
MRDNEAELVDVLRPDPEHLLNLLALLPSQDLETDFGLALTTPSIRP